jgi:hypothetical protein
VDTHLSPQPFALSGEATTIVYNKDGDTTGHFETEIESMSLAGDVLVPELGPGVTAGIQITEDPDQPSLGETTVTDLGGGLWHIDSFFDVFVEISVEDIISNPGTYLPPIPSTEGVRMDLFPEPGSLSLLGIGLLCLLGYAWRKRRCR